MLHQGFHPLLTNLLLGCMLKRLSQLLVERLHIIKLPRLNNLDAVRNLVFDMLKQSLVMAHHELEDADHAVFAAHFGNFLFF